MVRRPLKVGVVDIGTNSMRLLITDGVAEVGRWVEVTGLGRGVDATGLLSSAAVAESLRVLERFGTTMDEAGVAVRKAIATSASRDASNREEFFDRAEEALGVRPVLVSGEAEARYAYTGATWRIGAVQPLVVCDIGGGSTELVDAETAISVDVGSVRLTERALPSRPAPRREIDAARRVVTELLSGIDLGIGTLIGVAGTWTSLAAIAQRLARYSSEQVHGYRLGSAALQDVVRELATMTVEQTVAIPALDPRRAPVILAGAMIAESIVAIAGVDQVLISERDSLDGVALELLGG